MIAYFTLQFQMTNRKFRDAGIHPWLAWILLAVLFAGGSFYLFYKSTFAPYIYVLGGLVLAGKLSETRRYDFLKQCFENNTLRKLRMTENLLVVTPFLVFLLYKQLLLFALALLALAMLLALTNFRTKVHVIIPTPFYKKPFEFTTGFRNTYYLILAAYALTCIAVGVGNFNLGVFALLLVFGITLTYYTQAEHPYYVWIYSQSSRGFLKLKIKTAMVYATFLVLPIALALGLYFPQYILILIAFILLGLAYLICMIVSKYAAYPDELNVTQGILVGLCIWFPPLLIVMIPYLFRKSQHRLNAILS